MTYRVTILEGDGIGPEITAATQKIVEATGVKIKWEPALAGLKAIEAGFSPLPPETIKAIRKNKVALKGPLETGIGKGYASLNVLLRKTFNLYANVRPARNLPGVKTRFDNVDMVIFRENTEDLYSGIEHVIAPGVVESIKVITSKASNRIAKSAFEYAVKHGRKTITAIHKGNIMKISDGLFLDCCRKTAKKYPKIQYREMIVDNTCMQLVMRPEQFDILLLENLYGDIVSDLAAGLVGGLGVVPSGNFGEKVAIFEAVHGTAPDIAGQGKANPIALTLSACMMLDYLKETSAADKIRRAINKVLEAGKVRTGDLGGKSTTEELTRAIIKKL
jgi:isocitrate dehydrogenase (NAD+)